MLKKIVLALYIILLVVMAAATIIEKSNGTDYVHSAIYGAWWFVALWALLVIGGLIYIFKRKVKHVPTLILHCSFVVILIGALLTHISSKRGMVDLRMGEQPTDKYITSDDNHGMAQETLPFKIQLNKFETKYHSGTDAAADYMSKFTIIDGNEKILAQVSMNKIYSYRGVRFYQASYDSDGKGSVLSINSDPWGIPVTYVGYALLFISLIYMLFDPKGTYRKVLRSPLLKKGTLVITMMLAFNIGASAQKVLPKETAAKFGKLCILYNGRICPVQTYALDFCKKIYGARSYKGFTPEQVFTGWIFYYDDWSREPFIKVKSGQLKDELGLDDYCTLSTFFNPMVGNGYILSQYVEQYYNGNQDKINQQATSLDDKVMLIMQLRTGQTLKVLPYTYKGKTTWYAPTDSLPKTVEHQHALYIKNVFNLLNADVQAGHFDRVNVFFDKMRQYQVVSGGNSLPSPTQYKAERINNALPFATILFMVNLTLGFISLFFFIYKLTRNKQQTSSTKHSKAPLSAEGLGEVLLLLSFLALTFALILRWIISGTIPMSNGYETMLTVAWLVMLISLIMAPRFKIVLVFGFLLSGFFLLVSHINQMDPAIGQVMPVLNSPLLSIHVSIIMMSYALLSLTFICGLLGIFMRSHAAELQALSRVFLYPAITTLGIGIFIGAIWANVSWGTYWSWDSKETWALITFMIYAIVLHTQSLPVFNKPRVYHIYLVLAFLSIIMTYFGVNYFLTGMHSYA